MPHCNRLGRLLRSLLLPLLLLLAAGCATERDPQPGAVTGSAGASLPAEREPGRYRLTLLGDGRELEFLGELTQESAAELQRALLRNPQVAVLQLTGPGGDMLQAQRLSQMIAARGLTTYVPLECVSACAELFLAGARRYLAPDAALGFHRVWVVGLGPGSELETSSNAALLQGLLDRGVEEGFARRVMATPHQTVWYPGLAELQQAGVISGIRPRGDFAPPSTGADPSELLVWSSLNHATLWAFQAAYPDRHRALRLDLFADIRAAGFDLDSQNAIIDRALSREFGHALSLGGDPEITAFFATIRDTAVFLAAINPKGCGSLGLAGLELYGPEAAIAEHLSARADNAIAAVFHSIAEGRGRPAPSREAYEQALVRFAAGLVADGVFSDSEWVLFDNAERDPQRFCLVFAKLLAAMLAAPPEGRSTLLRGFALYG